MEFILTPAIKLIVGEELLPYDTLYKNNQIWLNNYNKVNVLVKRTYSDVITPCYIDVKDVINIYVRLSDDWYAGWHIKQKHIHYNAILNLLKEYDL